MSILLGPFDKSEPTTDKPEEKDLFVFGYACKLYNDEVKAILEDSGQLLIPWMGDSSLMVDRYDIRNRLEDKSQFGLKPNLPYRMSAEEEELEEELDKERYLALEWDDIRVEEQEEEEKKRASANSYSAVGFSYDRETTIKPQEPAVMVSNPQLPEHPSTSSVDIDKDDAFVPPEGLVLPQGIRTPTTNKLHSVIEKTALFISQQGPQMEIIIKAKQKFNPFFSFLDYGDVLHSYYRHIKEMLSRGAYVPRQRTPESEGQKEETGNRPKAKEDDKNVVQDEVESKEEGKEVTKVAGESQDNEDQASEASDSESDDEGGYLHPLLMRAMDSKSRTPTPSRETATSKVQTKSSITEASASSDENSVRTTTTSSFLSKTFAINSAPSLEIVVDEVHSQSSRTPRSHDIRQQQYGSSTRQPPPPQTVYGQAAHENSYYGGGTMYYHHNAHGYHHPHHQQQQPHPSQPQQHPAYSNGHYQSHGGVAGGQVYDYQAYYEMMSANHINQMQGGPTPTPPPPELKPVVDKMAEYVAKNGDNFERTVLERHAGDSRFNFINPWDSNHAYYQMTKQWHRQRLYTIAAQQGGVPDQVEQEPSKENNKPSDKTNVQRLNESGAVSFKLQSKKSPKKAPLLVEPRTNVFGEEEEGGDDDNDTEASEGVGGREESERGEGETEEELEDDIGEPPSKRRNTGKDKIGNKVQEFLTTVKAMFGADDD